VAAASRRGARELAGSLEWSWLEAGRKEVFGLLRALGRSGRRGECHRWVDSGACAPGQGREQRSEVRSLRVLDSNEVGRTLFP